MFKGADIVYKLTYVVGFALMMVINLLTRKRYELKKHITVIITLITYVAGVAGASIMGEVYSKVMNYHGFNSSTGVAIMGAVIFTPLFMAIVSLVLKQDWRKVLDMLAPGIFIILACAKFGCFLYGCCHGNECSFGIKYMNKDITVFPIQIVEVFLMALLIAFCFWYALKSKQYITGTVYPITTIIYCIMRFIIEFFRYYEFEEQRHMIFGMTLWQFCCILSLIACIGWIVTLNSKKISLYYEKKALVESEKQKQISLKKRKEREEKKRRTKKNKH